MHIKFMLAVVLSFLSLSTLASTPATYQTIVCDSCGDYSAKARAAGPGVHYVVNTLSGVVKKYQVVWMRGPGNVATEKAVEGQVANYVSFVARNKGSRVVLGVTDDFPQSGYEFVEYPQLQERVGAYIKEGGWGLVQDFLNYLNAVGSIGGFNSGAISITVKVTMADGSTALLVYDNTTQKWVAVKGQTTDSSGNTVPEKPEDFSGGLGSTREYRFPNNFNGNSDLVNFLDRAARLGIPITGSTGNIGTITVIVCVDGHCHPQTIQ